MSEPGTSPESGRGRRHLGIPLLVAGCAGAVALLVYNPSALLVLLVLAAGGFLLHLLAARLAEVDLLIPFLIGFGCLAIALLWFAPDLTKEFDERVPAPVRRLLSPVLRWSGAPDTATGGGETSAAPGPPARTPAPTPGGRAMPGGSSSGASSAPAAGAPAGSRTISERGAMTSGRVSSSGARAVQSTTALSGASGTRESVSVTLTAASPTSRAGESVRLTVFVRSMKAGLSFPCDRVDVFDGASNVATVALAADANGCSAGFALASLAVGIHRLTARYSGPAGLASSSPAVAVTVLSAR